MFTAYPTYDKFRTLSIKLAGAAYEDVFALQSGLITLGFLPVGEDDGWFGTKTDASVRKFQTEKGLTVDGLAGGNTQKKVATTIATSVSFTKGMPYTRLYGQLEHESSFRLGIYSVQYANGTFDAGVAQENTGFVDAKHGFTPVDAINALADRYVLYYGHFGGIDADRRGDLAQLAWNAPAWACFLAYEAGAKNDWVKARKSASLSDANRLKAENYIASVSAYA